MKRCIQFIYKNTSTTVIDVCHRGHFLIVYLILTYLLTYWWRRADWRHCYCATADIHTNICIQTNLNDNYSTLNSAIVSYRIVHVGATTSIT